MDQRIRSLLVKIYPAHVAILWTFILCHNENESENLEGVFVAMIKDENETVSKFTAPMFQEIHSVWLHVIPKKSHAKAAYL